MGDPILNLSSGSDWALVYQETKRAAYAVAPNYYPIPAFAIPLLLSSPILVIEAANIDARPWWWLGCRLQQVLYTGLAPSEVLGSFLNIPLNRPRLVRLPRLAPDYSLKVEIPPWFESMKISIYEYTGTVGDTTDALILEQSEVIRVDLARIESKINQL